MYEELLEMMTGYCTENIPIPLSSFKNTLKLAKEQKAVIMSDSAIANIGEGNIVRYNASYKIIRAMNFLFINSLAEKNGHSVLYLVKNNLLYILAITDRPFSQHLLCENTKYREEED